MDPHPLRSLESVKAQLEEVAMEKDRLHTQLKEAEMEVKRQKQQLLELQEKGALNGDVSRWVGSV